MRIITALKNRKYSALAIISAAAMLVVFPIIQTLATGGLQNLDLWFKVIPLYNFVLVFIFSILFGSFLSFQVYNLKSKVCPPESRAASATGGSLATILGMLVPACPSCISIVALFLPASLGISVAGVFAKYSSLLLSISILLLIFGIYLLGGFKKA